MKITVLSDNRKVLPDIDAEHGLSVYVETAKHKVLLDTGSSDLFIQNANKLGIDLSEVDYLFLSHGHVDHTGGLPYFMQINKRAKVIASSKILNHTYYSTRNGLHSISMDTDLMDYADRMMWVEQTLTIDKDINIFVNTSDQYPKPIANNALMCQAWRGMIIPDDFSHELLFTIEEEGLFVFTGCAHNGLLNILKTVEKHIQTPVKTVIGGFHLLDKNENMEYETDKDISEIASLINSSYPDVTFLTGHCTGNMVYNSLSSKVHQGMILIYSGFDIQV